MVMLTVSQEFLTYRNHLVTSGLSSSQEDFLREQSLDQDIVDKLEVIRSKRTDKSSNKIRKNFCIGKEGLLWKILKKTKHYDSKYRFVVPSSMKAHILHTWHDTILGGQDIQG